MPPWYALLNRLKKAPTFPLVVGALHQRGYLPSTDLNAGGLALFRDMAENPYLDQQRLCVSVKTCIDLKVPVFRLRPRVSVYDEGVFPSRFPLEATGGVRLRFAADVIPATSVDLTELYEMFYSGFKHASALADGLFSRNDRTWVDPASCKDYAAALAALDKVADRIAPITTVGG